MKIAQSWSVRVKIFSTDRRSDSEFHGSIYVLEMFRCDGYEGHNEKIN